MPNKDFLNRLRAVLADAHESDTGDLPNCTSSFAQWLAFKADAGCLWAREYLARTAGEC